jgi:hypothetical protein
MRHIVWITLLSIGCTGESRDGEVPDSVSRRDSAGIVILEFDGSMDHKLLSHSRQYDEMWTRPIAEDAGILDVSEARIISGHVAVASNRYEQAVVLLDLTTGSVVRRIGAPGDGPGEFRDVGALLPSDDSVVVYDRRLRRVTAFDLEGNVLTSSNAASQFGSIGGVAFAFPRAEGLVVFRIERATGEGHVTRMAHLERYDRNGRSASIGPIQGTEEYLQRRGAGTRTMSVPFGRRLIVSPVPAGVVVANTGEADIRQYDQHLNLRMIIRMTFAPRRLTPADIDEFVDSAVSQYSNPVVRRNTDRSLRSRHVHTTAPLTTELLIGTTGELWWRGDPPEGASSVYHVFAADGTVCCTVSLASPGRLLDADERFLLMLRTADSGGEELGLYKRREDSSLLN